MMKQKKLKVILWGNFYFTDHEICIVKALQCKNVDIRYYIPMGVKNLRGAIMNIECQNRKAGILPADIYKDLAILKNYINLSSVFIVNMTHSNPLHPENLWVRLKFLLEYLKFRPDIFHYTAPLPRTWWFLYYLRGKRVLTLHDPFPHSGQGGGITELLRIKSFKKSNRIILLSEENKLKFADIYGFNKAHITVSKLGYLDYLETYPADPLPLSYKYILFFGQIFSYKGIEYLLEAMVKVHSIHPEIKLVVAGGGKMYFDTTPYKNNDYIIIENKFIGLSRLISLLRGSMFSVAPYKDATQSGVLMNSFSLNVPMVVTNVGFFPEMVEDGVTGLIVDPCNVDQLADAMIRLVESPELLKIMRYNIETKWRPSMGWDKITDEFMKVYKS